MSRFLVRDGALDVVRAHSLAAARGVAAKEAPATEPVLVAVVVDELPVGAHELREISRVVDGWARGCACGAVLYSNEPIPDSTRCLACGSYDEEAFAPEHRTFIDLDGPAGSPWVSVEDRLAGLGRTRRRRAPVALGRGRRGHRRGTGRLGPRHPLDAHAEAGGRCPMIRTADISTCRRYRYRLGRKWGEGPTAVFVMLNPSTADAEQDDPTVRRCIGFAKAFGCGQLQVVNIFAWRTTLPLELRGRLRSGEDIVGPENPAQLVAARAVGDPVIAAWGTNVEGLARENTLVREWIDTQRAAFEGVGAIALRLTKGGHPAHPCRLPNAITPRELATGDVVVDRWGMRRREQQGLFGGSSS